MQFLVKTSNGEVKKYTEKITIGAITYSLVDYQFSQGTVTDNRATSDYYSGNIISRKPMLLKQEKEKMLFKTQ